MARDGTPIFAAKDEIKEITNAEVVDGISLYNGGTYTILVLGTVDATPPSAEDFEKCFPFEPGEAFSGTIADLFQGQGFKRLWVMCERGTVLIKVWHG